MKRLLFSYLIFLQLLSAIAQTTISGKVVDEEDKPLPLANVLIENTFIGTFTNSQGEFIIKNIKPGKYQLRVSFIGYESFVQNIEVKENVEPLVIKLKKSAFIADEIIVQATRTSEQNTANIKIIEKEELQNKQLVQDIPYLLSFSPSVVSSSDGGVGVGYTKLSVRGTDVRRINVTINDIPLNDAESHGVWWVDLPDIVSSTDNIQIQRGVGSSTNGAGAFGATINLQTKSLNKEPFAELFAGYGRFNTSKFMVNSGTGLINNRFSVDVRLSKIKTDGFIDRAFSDLKSYYFSAGYHSEKSMLKFIHFAGYEKTYQAWYGVPKDSLKTNPTFNPYTYFNQTDNYWQSHYQLHFTRELSHRLNLHSALHYTRGKGYYENFEDTKQFSSYGLPNFISGNDTIKASSFINQKWLDNDFYGYIGSLNYKHRKIDMTIGTAINRYEGRHFGEIIWAKFMPLIDPNYRWYYGTGDKIDGNMFVKTSYHLSEKIITTLDMQYRYIDYKIKGSNDDLRIFDQHHIFQFFNPKGSVYYVINSYSSLGASIATAHREPTRADFVDADTNKMPKAERLVDYELSYQWKSENVFLNLNAYYMNYFNQLVMTGELNNVGTPIQTNVGKSFRRGIEAELGLKLTSSLMWMSNATLSQNKIKAFTGYFDDWDNGGQKSEEYRNTDISFSPNLIANSMIQYTYQKKLAIQGIYKYVGSQYLSNTQKAETKIPAYWSLNLLINYYLYPQWCKEIQLQLSAQNLLTNIFVTHGWVYSYYWNGKLENIIYYYPQANNVVMGSIIFRF